MTELSLRRRLALLVTVAGLVAAVLAALTAVSLHRLEGAARDRLDVYGPAGSETDALARAYDLQALTAGSRDRADVTAAYDTARSQERAALRRLQSLLADGDRDLRRELAQVRAAARVWHDEAAGGAPDPAALTRLQATVTDLSRLLRERRDAAADSLAASSERLRDLLLVALAGLVVVAALTWGALRRWVLVPLHALGSEVERVEEGDLSRRVTIGSAPSEVAQLAEQVERMRVRILHEYALAEAARADTDDARTQLEVQAEDLRRSNAELEQFAYVASHDLQEPLRKVASFCQLIERRYKGQLDERGEQYIEFAVDGAKRMQQLINDLLAFSRVGRRTAEFEEVDLEVVLEQASRQLSELIAESGAVVSHDPLPAVRGDASLLAQLLQNLVGNGVKFRSEAPPRVHLSAVTTGDGFVEISCTDNGIGIEEQYEDKIFVIFQRLHGREAYGGTGIGLAMCKKIVEFHGGRLWLDTHATTTAGSTFRFTLPQATSKTEGRTRDDSAA